MPFTIVETGRSFERLQKAVDEVGNGRAAISIAPGLYRQCAVQAAGEVTFVAREAGSVIFDGTICEGKAALVLRGRLATVSGLVFQNMHVSDFNGSGIRLERGNLEVKDSWFRDSQQGILTASDPASRIVIDRSTFTRLGTCEGAGGCAHSIYVGEYGRLRVTNSRFEQGVGGHYVKSRSAIVEIAGSSFDDSAGKRTNYMIDLPHGATGQISNNWFVQGRDKENFSTFIAVASEGKKRSSAGLAIVNNDARLVPGLDRKTAFVADWSGDVLAPNGNALDESISALEHR